MTPWSTGCRAGAGWLLLLALSAPAQAPPAATTLAELRQQLAAHVAQSRFDAAMWGVKIVSRDTGKTIFEHNARKLFSPASNCKLLTMAFALDRLGGDYRIKTSLYATARPGPAGVLKGDLRVYGRGDPTFNPRRHGGDIFAALEPLVAALTNAGVRRVTGDLIGDESFIVGPPYGSGWSWDDMEYYYGAEISALTINDNTLELSVKPGKTVGAPAQLALAPATGYLVLSNRTTTVTNGVRRSLQLYRPLEQNVLYVTGRLPLDDPGFTDTVTVHEPAGLFIAFFKEALARHGIKVRGRLRATGWLERLAQPPDSSQLVELGSVESPPLRELVREVQKPSQNLYTDLILAHIGSLERASEARTQTSENAGVRALETFLERIGVRRGDVQFEEGSGLSRNNLATPDAIVTVLRFMSRHPEADAYLNALPVAGVDGTLRNRMKNTPAAGKVRAKTGMLRWATSLSGHVTTAAGEALVFSLMLNRYAAPDAEHSARAEIDRIAVMLAAFAGRSDE
jgi:D-alanyl-D-alanine carboxypeptidase/D-alanyl-D-alanine-endopeptidase (penicillin-binding protein 4)